MFLGQSQSPFAENNKPPVADAGPEKELTLPVDRTTLDGSKSSDDQKIATYRWRQIKSVRLFHWSPPRRLRLSLTQTAFLPLCPSAPPAEVRRG